jgi:hypothetical protein
VLEVVKMRKFPEVAVCHAELYTRLKKIRKPATA